MEEKSGRDFSNERVWRKNFRGNCARLGRISKRDSTRAIPHPILRKLAELLAIRRVPEPAVTRVFGELFLPIPDRLPSFGPVPPAIVASDKDEQIVKFVEGRANATVIAGLTPIGEALLRRSEELDSCFEKPWAH